jgi:cysteine synthase
MLKYEIGYKCICVLPDDQAKEKSDLVKMYGADVHIVKTASIASPQHYVNYARKLASEIEGGVFMDQFENQANFNVHFNRTGPEIWNQMNGNIDAFVMSAGTGGTIAGVSQYLKLKTNNKVKIVLADPFGSSLLNYVLHGVCWAKQQSERSVRRHRYDSLVEGVGLDRVTKNMAQSKVDHGYCISDQDAVNVAHYLIKHEGLIIGSSSAMNIAASILYAKNLEPGSRIVTVLCDSGQRHMTRFWNPEFIVNYRQLHWPTPQEADQAVYEMAKNRKN